MLFNSFELIFIFLPITFFIYFYLLNKNYKVGAKGFLVLVSLFFYSWWNIIYLPLILLSMLFNYSLGKQLNHKQNKSILMIGIGGNLLLLGYFKYADFFIQNINYFTSDNIGLLHLALPLAISFFTFQQIAYLVDSYRQETSEYDFLNYALFVSFFPQLIAGPIVHHKEMMPQFINSINYIRNKKNIIIGFSLFSIGLFKKVIIADTFAIGATKGFDVSETLTFMEGWITSLSYTFQLYFDFSGYSDMAIGLALLFNIKLPINFNSPYKAKNIQDFWRRWHITLSHFLRDYIYIPLGGSRYGEYRTYINLMVTFLLGGIWHGAGWTFIFWGALHGLALILHSIWSKFNIQLNVFLAWFITFNFLNISWVFFRAKDWDAAMKVLSAMIDVNSFSFCFDILSVIYILLSIIAVLWSKNSQELAMIIQKKILYLYMVLFLLFVSLLQMNNILISANVSEFLYFNF